MNSSDARSLRRGLLRLAAGLVLALGIGAPSPGYTGGCGLGGGGTADPMAFCIEKETYVCARECNAMRYTPEMCSTMCGTDAAIVSRCNVTWPAGCAPTQTQTQACIQALRDESRLATPSNEIPECRYETLCSGSGLTSSELVSGEPEGI